MGLSKDKQDEKESTVTHFKSWTGFSKDKKKKKTVLK